MTDFGCEKCWHPEASKAWAAVGSIPVKMWLIDESHYIVSIRVCPSCAQHYLQVTTEMIDWEGGNDPVCRTIVPIDDSERVKLVTSDPLYIDIIESVGVGRRSLKYDWPANQARASVYWSEGVRVGAHD